MKTFSELSETLTAKHPKISNLRIKCVAQAANGMCDIWNIYNVDGSLWGTVEDDGSGYQVVKDANGLNSASLDRAVEDGYEIKISHADSLKF